MTHILEHMPEKNYISCKFCWSKVVLINKRFYETQLSEKNTLVPHCCNEYYETNRREDMKQGKEKFLTIGITAVPETRTMLDKLSKHENKKIKPLFEDMLVSYIQQKYNEKIQPVESLDKDMQNTKQMIDELSSALERQKDEGERELMQSKVDTFERYYGVLLARKNCCLEEASAYQGILTGGNAKDGNRWTRKS